MSSPSEQTLLVTGANGYVALHVINEALSRGYNVRGTVRSESSAAKIRPVFASHGSKFSVAVVPDLSNKDLYAPAFADTPAPVTGVINVAAPFTMKVDDPVAQLLDPAVKTALGVLEATRQFGPNVRRVVNTSSFACILDLAKGYRPGYTYTEKDWNPMTFEQAAKADNGTAYCASKALAEKAMWDWIEKEKPSFSLTTIQPPWIFGPHLTPISNLSNLNESSEAIWRLLDATEVPPTDFAGFADVRVVAKAHIEAFERPEAAGERFLCGQHFDYQSAVDALREAMPQLKDRLPVGTPGAGKTQDIYQLDGSKAERILGIKYTPLEVTLKDSFEQLLAAEA
ncbi:NAD(P)-binding protein [Trichoderma citrinoviride]|uniref:NAD(P)-binding protein n=1 Tax=Trichoderma citrinoviride TaxID=58853 RepID=A0A2T4B277_9HYPO|nr:NAD(P)-binding protein [Trichoderma citrinoviride]PTB63433.1 NAD(P)-binding protein [Trichoderma citrinoviride]